MERRIPELSFADYTQGKPDQRAAFVDALTRALQQYGFIILRDHPIPSPLLEQANRLIIALFAQIGRAHV